MKRSNEMAPTGTLYGVDTPPDGSNPTSAQLKADIDSGRTGDKIDLFDPGLSPLGTDDEAAGTPPSAARIRLARTTEAAGAQGARSAPLERAGSGSRAWIAYVAGSVAIGAIIVVGVYAGLG